MRTLLAIALTGALGMALDPCLQAGAASLFLYVPGITGTNSTPGYPGAMAIQSLTVTPDNFSVTKNVDISSSTIVADITSAKPLHTSNVLLYNSPPSGPPDAALAFQNVIASSHVLLGGGTTELDSFATSTPETMYLELPGITGESSTPGHSGVIPIESFSLTGNDFSIVKNVDSASPAIDSLVLNGMPISTASILFYNSAPLGSPDATLTFQEVLGSSYHVTSGGDVPLESVTFHFINVVPEPSSMALLGAGAIGLAIVTRCGRKKLAI
jgi:type VI protein secretion system component Hcp